MKNLRTPEMTKNCDISIFQAFPIPDLQKVGFVEYHFFFWHLGRPRKSLFYISFCRSNLVSFERVRGTTCKSQFYRSFWRSNLILCERVARDDLNALLPQFLALEPHFVRKGCAGQVEITILL